jgi:hypothetical protein
LQQAQSARTKLTFMPNDMRTFSLKRKVGYGLEDKDVDDAGRQLQRMRVDSAGYSTDA